MAKAGESPLETAVREAEEETGLAARAPEIIGQTNQNTAYHLFDTPIVRVSLGPEVGRHKPDPTEGIARPPEATSILKTVAEIAELIRSGQIVCGFTKAAFVTQLIETQGNPFV
jgi:8-oxo-dGTP pyrophosphatase MutT (NUDIX family)